MITAITATLVLTGTATYYAEGVFPMVAEYRFERLKWARCDDCIGYAALVDRQYLQERVWISNGAEWVGPLHVIDCGATQHLPGLKKRGIVGEVDRWLARRWNMRGPIPVSVRFTEPEDSTDDRPTAHTE